MVSFRQLHSHLKLLSHDKLKGTRTESGFKRAFATLFGQDVETFIGTMFLNMDQLEKQLDKEEFQEIGSMTSFKVLEKQFQMFIKSRMYLDDEFVVMTRNYFLQYTQLSIPEFRDTLIQHVESVKKSIDERALHKREYDTRVNERHIQITEDKTAEINVFAIGQQHIEQPEFNNDGESDDMVQYITTLKEAKKKDTTKAAENSEPSVMPSARSQSTTNGSKPTPRINNQKSRNWPASKSSCVTTKTVPIAEHSRNSSSFSDSKHFVCSKSPEMWNQWVKIFKTVGLRWVPTGKIFTSSTTKVDSEPINGSNDDITNQYECKQTLDGFKEFSSDEQVMTSDHNHSELGIQDHSNEQSSSKLVPKVVP
ncbi:hypothetical protein Tco_0007594 [Tanacetum coccineum]